MKNLDREYISVNTIYEQQKEYRKTKAGKLALRRAKERQLLKKMNRLYCQGCGYDEFECLTVVHDKTFCYNCKFRRPVVLEDSEICQ